MIKSILNIIIIKNEIFLVEENLLKKTKALVPNANICVVTSEEVTEEQLKEAHIIFGWPNRKQLKVCKQLQWLHLPSAGADRYIDKQLYANDTVILTNSSGVYGMPIAEHVLGMILMHTRRLQEYAYYKKEKKWHRLFEGKDFFGSTLGIIGLGDIGNEIAKRAKAMGVKVLGVKRRLGHVPDYVDGLYTLEQLDHVLKMSDFIVIALPSTEKTRGLFNEETFKMMKKDAFLVNIGRGNIVDQEALIKALEMGWIGGAGLDVMVPEPLPEDSPLWTMENVILTPHVSGYSPSNTSRRFDIFNENLLRFIKNEPLINKIDFNQGY